MAFTSPAASATKSTVADVLLSGIPEGERSDLCSRLIGSLRPDDDSGLDIMASIIVSNDDSQAEKDFISFLAGMIESSHAQPVLKLASKYAALGTKLYVHAAERLDLLSISGDGKYGDGVVISYLSFIKSARHCSVPSASPKAFGAALRLLCEGEETVCLAARNSVFSMLTASAQHPGESRKFMHAEVWNSIQLLQSRHSSKLYRTLTYSLWLRWILSVPQNEILSQGSREYWNQLQVGLRHGDSEVRKLCLNILKHSIGHAPLLRLRFDRYCTLFETIVLSRYINQVQECERDLNKLICDDQLAPEWLYVLLSSAMDNSMQDSNRKFIGSWVTRASIEPTPQYCSFLLDSFLPWAMQGHLFVSSLKRQHDGTMQCEHGNKLVKYIRDVLAHIGCPGDLRTRLWEYQSTQKPFAYAKVYLLEALYSASSQHLFQSTESLPQLLRGLPEVAKDYVTTRLRQGGVKITAERSRREILEREAIARCSDMAAEDSEDVWADLEYLEYPKDLLIPLPSAILQPALIDRAAEDEDFGQSLRRKLHALAKVAETKTFLFPPLMSALRLRLATHPDIFHKMEIMDILVSVAEHPPEPTVDLMLEESIIPLTSHPYEHYFGQRLGVGFAAYLDLIGRLNDQSILRELSDRVLRRWRNQKSPPPTVSAWKNTLQLQVILLAYEQRTLSPHQANSVLEDMLNILSVEPLPRYRYLLEWIIVRLYIRQGRQSWQRLIDKLGTVDHHANPKYLASLMRLGSILAGCSEADEGFAFDLAKSFVPLAASSKVVIRHEAQWQMPILMDQVRSRKWQKLDADAAFTTLDKYIRHLTRFTTPANERLVGRFNPLRDHTFTNLVEGHWFALDNIEGTVTSRDDIAALYRSEYPSDAPEPCLPLGEAIRKLVVRSQEKEGPTTENISGLQTSDDVTALQTKGAAYLARTLPDPSSVSDRRSSIIVVGSLVDNPYNLGGLSRVSEIFGASALTLQNQNVISNKDFTSVAVSSHLHFPIVQLSADGIPDFLTERKTEGFTVVGIEQTDRSVMLGHQKSILPEKVVLVVGSEKEGIPAIVLTECDLLVEIPQQGVTRSLNVQTAVSIVLYEYARQHRRRA